MNIDAARIPLQADDEYVINTFDDGAKPFGDGAGHEYTSRNESQGRWPANFVVDDVTAQRLNQQTGTLTSGKPSGKKSAENMVYGKYKNEDVDVTGFGDSGGASRFFYNVSTTLDESDPIYYCSKASVTEKENGLFGNFPCVFANKENYYHDTDSFTSEEHYSIDKNGEQIWSKCRRSIHPTHKPISLCQWLATLLLPPDMYAPRNLLVPFSGVGSEMIGGLLAGWDRILGIEKDTENNYVDMSYKRLEYYANAKDIK